MEATEGATSFRASGDAYDQFMGRYSRLLADAFADAAGDDVIDVGCGSGALTTVLVDWARLDSPPAEFSLAATARCAVAQTAE